ncbi:SRPBCC domain-containing protein [Pelomicrobium sp.]|jgi:uncharacterized protein YndB with AHSA1/START domain|uniref:SRPBCC domain-containing protein n=1 Tax=Pelomicrobium sp. TaxID=2815319 RepID=UPI002FDE89E9
MNTGEKLIVWRIHLRSSPEKVYEMIATDEGRRRFWAESADERDGTIDFRFPNGMTLSSRILEALPPKRFSVEYFAGSHTTFECSDDDEGGTDLTLTDAGVPRKWRSETAVGWVSVLLALKAAVDFNIDLRNHHGERTWDQSYVDN